MQFLVCGAVQLLTDLVIVLQFWLYLRRPEREAGAPSDGEESAVEMGAPPTSPTTAGTSASASDVVESSTRQRIASLVP